MVPVTARARYRFNPVGEFEISPTLGFGFAYSKHRFDENYRLLLGGLLPDDEFIDPLVSTGITGSYTFRERYSAFIECEYSLLVEVPAPLHMVSVYGGFAYRF